jgi:hypothetical protein
MLGLGAALVFAFNNARGGPGAADIAAIFAFTAFVRVAVWAIGVVL